MLELKNVCYSAENNGEKKDIIKDVSLDLSEKFIAFTGPNGGGKSTLAKLIMGILKPTSGRIIFDGKDITDLSVTDRARAGIAFAFQQPVKFKGITVTDLIEIASGKKLSVSEICSYLSEVGLCAREYVYREINSGIDLWSFNSLIRVFENLAAKTSESLLIISHQERILSIADRIVVISDGKVAKDGKGADVLPELLSVPSACNVLQNKSKEAL